MRTSRLLALGTAVVLAAGLAACASPEPTTPQNPRLPPPGANSWTVSSP
ncbi:hypothetical protein [Microbacterium sp. NIBRBAC000506063]|nr:hypothetical protein [Microbacterium sp. NIBRBAC000506063]